MMNTQDEIFLTSQQAAKILQVSLSTLKKFIYSGRLKTLKTPGGHHRILKKDLFEMPHRQTGLKNKLAEISEGAND